MSKREKQELEKNTTEETNKKIDWGSLYLKNTEKKNIYIIEITQKVLKKEEYNLEIPIQNYTKNKDKIVEELKKYKTQEGLYKIKNKHKNNLYLEITRITMHPTNEDIYYFFERIAKNIYNKVIKPVYYLVIRKVYSRKNREKIERINKLRREVIKIKTKEGESEGYEFKTKEINTEEIINEIQEHIKENKEIYLEEYIRFNYILRQLKIKEEIEYVLRNKRYEELEERLEEVEENILYHL